jgi:prepilin-type N-terminal cleavage/methylation domain-containing protein
MRRRLTRATRDWIDDEGGFSLLEMIVAIAVLSVIMTPLSIAFITMLQRSAAVENQLSRSSDAQRIGAAWTEDVQNVDVGGVNAGGECPSRSGGSAVEAHIVTFSWDRSTTTSAPSKSATWSLVGAGGDMELVRRYCENDVPLEETVLADQIGQPGLAASAIVHGPVPSQPRDFCPPVNKGTAAAPRLVSESCTLVVEGGTPTTSYRMTATRRVPEGDPSGPVDTVPPPPTITSATGRNTYVSVAWSPPPSWTPPVDGYRAHVYADPNGSPLGSVDVDGTSNSADLTGLANDTPYFVRVQSHNAIGWGDLSPAYGPVVAIRTAPDAPSVLTVAPGDTTIAVTWSPNANDGGDPVTSWRLFAVGATTGEVGPQIVNGGGATSATITGLKNGDTYRVSLEAVNGIGVGLRSDPSTTVVPYGIPGKATITSVSQRPDGKVRITWTPPSTNPPNAIAVDGGRPIEGYRVERVSGPAGGPWPSSSTWTSASTTQLDLDGLTLGSTYTFRILTKNARGSSVSNTSAAVVAAAQPNVPAVTAVQNGAGAIKVDWTPPPDNGAPITHYVVTMTPNVAGSGSPRTINVPTLTTTFTGLTSGTTYTFSVVAHNSAGVSNPGTASARALGQPSAPGGVGVARQAGNTYPFAVNVTWSRPANDGGGCIKSYRVEYSTNGSTVTSSNTLSTTPAPNCTGEPGLSYGWSGITAGVLNRFYRVVAVNTGNLEAASGWVSIQMFQECNVTATEDSWVNEHNGSLFTSSSRGNNYGGDGNLRVDSSGDQLYVKFNPLASGGSNCHQFPQTLPASAVVDQGWVHINNNSPTSFNRDHRLTRVTGNWAEGSITYNNRPGIGGNLSLQSGSNGGWREFGVPAADVEAQRVAGSRFGFNIRDTGGNVLSDWVTYSARTTGSAPYLRIRFY